jgi:hypothetical protein
MLEAEKEVIIYCPFISKFRSDFFRQTLLKLRKKNVDVFIFTRPLEEHECLMRSEISCALKDYEELIEKKGLELDPVLESLFVNIIEMRNHLRDIVLGKHVDQPDSVDQRLLRL